MTNYLFFLPVSIASTTFQRLRHACWHLKTILAAYGCLLRVGTFRTRLPNTVSTSDRIKIPWPKRPERPRYECMSCFHLVRKCE